MIVNSGAPYNITLSQDLIGTAHFNQRPVFANGATGPNIVTIPGLGSFNTVPPEGATPIPVDFLTGPTHFTFNLRLSKTFGFGKESASAGGQGGPRGGGGHGGRGAGGPFGGGGGGIFGGPGAGTNHRYNVTFSVNARNVFNYVNAGTPGGVLNPPTADVPQASPSPFFGRSNQLAVGPFSGNGASRLIYLQASFSF